jgi:hypothetical protein
MDGTIGRLVKASKSSRLTRIQRSVSMHISLDFLITDLHDILTASSHSFTAAFGRRIVVVIET